MTYFVSKDSIIRRIWGKGDTILFIFAGAAAEFALNKAVDWLYFTGRLPSDPLGRLFSTVAYARQIVFSENDEAFKAIDQITAIHKKVEASRGAQIPDWAYRDVLFMLIDYSIRSFELLERKLTETEKEEVFNVFFRVGHRMEISSLPLNYQSWLLMRNQHLKDNLIFSEYTADLYQQYKKHLGLARFTILKQAQILVVPERVNGLLSLGKLPVLAPAISIYKLSGLLKLDKVIRNAILPKEYISQVNDLDIV